jgi:site-specific recombinase XerD
VQRNPQGVFEKLPGTGIWWIRWTDHKGKRHKEKVGRQGDAVTLYSKRRADTILRRKMPENFRGAVLFDELCKDALEHSRDVNSPAWTKNLETKIRCFLVEFGGRSAESITRQEIQQYLIKAGQSRKWTPATRNRHQSSLSLVFRIGVDNEKIPMNPVSRLKRKTESRGRTRFLSSEEEVLVTGLVTKLYPEKLPAFLISLHTGLRASEQWRLQWKDVDLGKKILTAHGEPGRTLKNKENERHVPLNAIALAAFRKLDDRRPNRSPSAPVFLNTEGQQLRGHRDWFDPIRKEARLDGYSWHCHRHSFASRLVMAGVDIRTVGELLGHKSIQMTMRYAHLAPAHNAAAVEMLVGNGHQIGHQRSGAQSEKKLK